MSKNARYLFLRKAPDVQNTCPPVLICVAFRKRDAPVDDDRTIPVAATRIQHCDLPPGFRYIDAESAIEIVHVKEPAGDHGARAPISVVPHLPQSATAKSPCRGS